MVALKEHYGTIKKAGYELLGISVDTPEKSAKFRAEEGLPFELLSDTDRATIKRWNILNSKEAGGIAFPNVYVIDQDASIVFHSADRLASRADPSAILKFVNEHSQNPGHRLANTQRKTVIPTLRNFILGFPRQFGWIK